MAPFFASLSSGAELGLKKCFPTKKLFKFKRSGNASSGTDVMFFLIFSPKKSEKKKYKFKISGNASSGTDFMFFKYFRQKNRRKKIDSKYPETRHQGPMLCFLNIFAKKVGEKVGFFDSKRS
jgi:hypothetical protein